MPCIYEGTTWKAGFVSRIGHSCKWKQWNHTEHKKKTTVFLIDHLMSVFSTYKKKLIIPLTALLRELL